MNEQLSALYKNDVINQSQNIFISVRPKVIVIIISCIIILSIKMITSIIIFVSFIVKMLLSLSILFKLP